MLTIRLHQPGGLEGLTADQTNRPEPSAGEAVVRVHAAALTRDELDWPLDRLPAVPSYELSGVVDAVGDGVEDVKPGDEVFAMTDFDRDGVAAEYAAVPADLLVRKPASLDHMQAAALPLPALSAWQGLFVHGGLARGDRVVITGRTGGVGHLAEQFARWRGAELVDEDADVVFDTAGGEALEHAKALVRDGGRVVSVANEAPGVTYFVVQPDAGQLTEIARLADEGAIRPEIDSVFQLRDARSAFERLSARGKRGKVVLSVAETR